MYISVQEQPKYLMSIILERVLGALSGLLQIAVADGISRRHGGVLVIKFSTSNNRTSDESSLVTILPLRKAIDKTYVIATSVSSLSTSRVVARKINLVYEGKTNT